MRVYSLHQSLSNSSGNKSRSRRSKTLGVLDLIKVKLLPDRDKKQIYNFALSSIIFMNLLLPTFKILIKNFFDQTRNLLYSFETKGVLFVN
jgi:hypothetical protein